MYYFNKYTTFPVNNITSCSGYAALYTHSAINFFKPLSCSLGPNFSFCKMYDITVILTDALKKFGSSESNL